MAIAYQSIATTDFNEVSPGTLTISKPSGLAEDDMMIAYIVWDSNNTTAPTLPSGWTQLLHDTTGIKSAVAYKLATSGDVAASNFVFTLAGTVNASGGSIMRWSDVGLINAGTTVRDNTTTTTPSFAGGITPGVANSYLIMCYHSPYTHTVSDYAITTDNPTWTEVMDEQNVSPDLTMSLAYASRPETTATGNFTVTTSSSHNDHNGVLIYLSPRTDVNLSMPVGTLTLSSPTPSLTVDVTLPMPVGTLTLTGNAPTITTSENTVWTEESKNFTTWTEESK